MPRRVQKYCSECGAPINRGRLFSVKTLAKTLDVSEKYIWTLVYDQRIGHCKIGRLIRISDRDLRDFMERNQQYFPSIDNQSEVLMV